MEKAIGWLDGHLLDNCRVTTEFNGLYMKLLQSVNDIWVLNKQSKDDNKTIGSVNT